MKTQVIIAALATLLATCATPALAHHHCGGWYNGWNGGGWNNGWNRYAGWNNYNYNGYRPSLFRQLLVGNPGIWGNGGWYYNNYWNRNGNVWYGNPGLHLGWLHHHHHHCW